MGPGREGLSRATLAGNAQRRTKFTPIKRGLAPTPRCRVGKGVQCAAPTPPRLALRSVGWDRGGQRQVRRVHGGHQDRADLLPH